MEETGKRPHPDALPVDFQSPDDELKICQSKLDAIQPVVSVLITEFNEDQAGQLALKINHIKSRLLRLVNKFPSYTAQC